MKTPAEVDSMKKNQHSISWDSKKCIKCGINAKELTSGRYVPCGEPQFHYNIPLVANVVIKIPEKCYHYEISAYGVCLDCGKDGLSTW